MGIGTRLVEAAEEWCRKEGSEYAYMATESSNAASLNLFTLKFSYTPFRFPCVLVHPVHAHPLPRRGRPADTILRLSPALAEPLYRRLFLPHELGVLSSCLFSVIGRPFHPRPLHGNQTPPPSMPSRSLLLGCRRFLPLGGGGGGGGSRTLSYASPFQHQRAPPSVPGPPPVPTSPFPSAAALWGGSASATWPPPAPPPPPPSYQPPRPYNPMVSYLIRACGFSFDEATEASEILAGKKSTPNPASSASSARGRSPLETQIGWLVSSAPPSPGGGGGNYGAIGDVGFSGRTLAQLMLLDPGVLTGADASRKIGFWCALFRAEADLMQALESNTHTLGSGPKETVVKKMILLQGCGMPNRELRKLLRNESKAVARSADSLEALIKRVEELGLARGRQAAYQYALQAIGTLAKKKLEHKLGAICRDVGQGEPMTPQLVGNSIFQLSPMDAGKAMDSSFKEARMETSNSPAHSIPLALSLEKKMMPPYYLLQILKSKDYLDENRASYILRMCKKARFWTNSYASVNREFRSFMKLSSLLVQGRIAV